jgi:hypothetical protein
MIEQGQRVFVRAFGGKILVRRVWEATPDVVYICSEDNYERLSKGLLGLWPVAFPREYVFRYDPTVARTLPDPAQNADLIWERLESLRFDKEPAATDPRT